MNPSRPFIQHSVMTFIISITVMILGIFTYFKMPVSDLPNTEFPAILVSASYPGATPKTMESSVTIPLEKQLMMCEGLKAIASTSKTGSCSVVLEFELSRSIDFAAQDVLSALNRAAGDLPTDLPTSPTYSKVNPTEMPILFMHLTSDNMKQTAIFDFADDVISRRISMVGGVSQVDTYGSPFAVRVQLNPKLLAARNLSYQDVLNTIQSGNTNKPTGALWGQEEAFNIVSHGQIFNGEGYGDLVIRKNDAFGLLKIKDVGHAKDSAKNDEISIDLIENGKAQHTVFMSVQKQPGENTIAVTDHVLQAIDSIHKELPGGLKLTPYFTKAKWILEAVDDVKLTLFIAFILVICIVYLTLGKFTSTLVPLVTLPLSILGTFIFMYLLGYSIDVLSLFAITLSVGFLVDDTIIVVENIFRHIEMGQKPMDAAIEGSRQISLTVISTTLSLVAVFIPMFLMGGFLGRLFREFASVICIALFFSAFFSLSIGPLLCSRWMKPMSNKGSEETEQGEDNPTPKLGMMERFSNAFGQWLTRIYRPSLDYALKFKFFVVLGGAVCFGLTLGVAYLIPKNFFPDDDLGIVSGITIFPERASPQKRIRVQREINTIISKNPHVDKIASVSGSSDSFPGAVLWPLLKPINDRPSGQEVINQLYASLNEVPGVQIAMTNFKLINLDVGTSQSQGDYSYALSSLNSDLLYKTAIALQEKMKHVPGLIHVSSDMHIDKPQAEIHIDRDKATALGISASDIEQSLGLAFAGAKSSQISTSSAQYDVIIEVEPNFYQAPQDLSSIYVGSSSGKSVPLSAFAAWDITQGAQSIQHINGIPAVTLYFSLDSGITLGEGIERLEKAAQETIPPDVVGALQGTAAAFSESNIRLIIVLGAAIFVIYAILAILYGSFIHPLTPLSALPAASLGAFLTLMIFDEPFSIYAFVGTIMLIGIVMKNGIMMIEFARELMVKQNKEPYDAMMEAALTRLRPIIMTTISTIMGALPIAAGVGGAIAKTHRSLGLVIIGGLIISQLITLYLTPCAFIYLEKARAWGLKHKPKQEER